MRVLLLRVCILQADERIQTGNPPKHNQCKKQYQRIVRERAQNLSVRPRSNNENYWIALIRSPLANGYIFLWALLNGRTRPIQCASSVSWRLKRSTGKTKQTASWLVWLSVFLRMYAGSIKMGLGGCLNHFGFVCARRCWAFRAAFSLLRRLNGYKRQLTQIRVLNWINVSIAVQDN